MYGGPPRPNPSLYHGRSRPFSPNFRPRFGNTGFPSSQHGIHPSQFGDFGPRQPCPPARSPFGKNPPPWGQEQVFQPKGGQMQGLRSGFRPTGFQPQRRHKKSGGFRGSDGSPGVEAYYSRAMVEDPWKELEEKYKEKEEQSS